MPGDVRHHSQRILIDLQACQTPSSAHRGVGRYASELFSAMAVECGARDLFALVGSHHPTECKPAAVDPSRVLQFSPPENWASPRDYLGGEEDSLDGLALSTFLAPTKPDIIHVSHVFEGFGGRVALPSFEGRASGQVISATLYDLIPLLFQNHYFRNENFRKWFYNRLSWLRKADLLLSISESSRQDAINLLGMEPGRIVTVHGGIMPHFSPAVDREIVRRELVRRYGLRGRFVLYAGGDDHRKNISGAIAGYACVSPERRTNSQLVIVCAMGEQRKKIFLEEALKAGLESQDVVITGFIPEDDLVAFYNACDAFVFPSLYEGLGLPVLEAMACGAPVAGGDNSSVRELIARPDALFDASSPQAIGDMIGKMLTDKAFSEDLRAYGLKRSQEFSWKKTARLAIEAFDEAVSRARVASKKGAIHGWLPRKRLAMFTPLPPRRSGIADYNAKFLPFLARHFDIDLYVDGYQSTDETLTSAFRIFEASSFPSVAQNYDAILYELGNSDLHAHMLPLIAKYPGVVGLHDAYLGGLFSHLDVHMGQTGCYVQEMLASHGPAARRFFMPQNYPLNMPGDAAITLPCTKKVIDQAVGLISHSPFNLEVARLHYPEGWQAPYRIIPQMVSMPRAWSDAERAEARKKLDIGEKDIVIATFGHIAWTKWGDRLLDAFLSSDLTKNENVHLVYVGELARDEFGRSLNKLIVSAGLGRRIRITDFLSETDYEFYLRTVDIAVQLRTKSRGGTPKGVLDCLAYGLPVIVNNDASYRDYPDEVVIKISAEPSAREIAEQLETLVKDAEKRVRYGETGPAYVREHHDPAHCAASYAAAIYEFMESDRQVHIQKWVPTLAAHLADCPQSLAASDTAINWLARTPRYNFERRRLFIDVTHIARFDYKSGIQRVVKQIVKQLYGSARPGFEPVAVQLIDGVLCIASAWLEERNLLSATDAEVQRSPDPVQFRAGDVLLMLDSSWGLWADFAPFFAAARAVNVPIYSVIHDLLILNLPAGNFPEDGKEWFEAWLRSALFDCDGIICVSLATAADVFAYMKSIPELTEKPRIGYFHEGADFIIKDKENDASSRTAKMRTVSYILMVGTIEPRKNHALALAAMEKLWSQGHELCLCIAGKEGWMVEGFGALLRQHPLSETKLFYFESPDDKDLNYLYANAAALLAPSKGEGFGLPLVEAANHGTPIICSDIPVFHEVAGNFATYVPTDSAEALAQSIENWWVKNKAGELPDTHDMPRLTWEQSADALLDVIFNNKWIKE